MPLIEWFLFLLKMTTLVQSSNNGDKNPYFGALLLWYHCVLPINKYAIYMYRRYSFKTSYLHFWWKMTFLYLIGCRVYCATDGDITIFKSQSESSKNRNFCVFQELVCHIMLVFWACENYSHSGTYQVFNCTYLSELVLNLCATILKWI